MEVGMARIRVRTNGGRPARERMLDRRIAQENMRSTAVAGPTPVMGFGKFSGVPVTDVDDGYLVWCAENMTHCPLYIIGELNRRGRGTANWALSSSLSDKQKRREKKRMRGQIKSERMRASAIDRMKAMASGVVVTGDQYARLSAEFLRAGGDETSCPFDCDDYQYEGPTVAMSGGRPTIIPSEFPSYCNSAD
jgi:hypothetical protein